MLALLIAAPVGAGAPAPTTLAQSAEFIGTALNVADLDRALRFYREALGLTLATTLQFGAKSETILRFPGNPAQPSLLLMHDTSSNPPKAIAHGNGFSRLVIRVNDIAALEQRLTRLGYAHDAVRAGGQGYRVMMMRDPEGFQLEIVQPAVVRSGQ